MSAMFWFSAGQRFVFGVLVFGVADNQWRTWSSSEAQFRWTSWSSGIEVSTEPYMSNTVINVAPLSRGECQQYLWGTDGNYGEAICRPALFDFMCLQNNGFNAQPQPQPSPSL